ncbi:MAG TPA: AIPR family protein, partial [Candidatus Kapabacteria bacterium]|nr:AIPR family protein [Candidatus Kapabacteria bacterium]
LKELEDPSIFAFRHNGVTLAAERLQIEDGQVTLHAPRLLNGAQTVSSVERFFEERADNPLLEKNRLRLNEIRVLAKLVEDNDLSSEFVTRITISNNQQNPVPPWALRAMDTRQMDLAEKFAKVGIFYSRQEGAFANLSETEKDALGIEDPKDLGIRPLAQTFLTIQGDIHNMAHLPEVFENQKLYENTFKCTYLNSNAQSIVLAYKVGLMLNRVSAHLEETMAVKYQAAIPKARFLIWALLVQALMNDRNFPDYQESYGSSLRKEVTFAEILKRLAGIRITPILKELLNSSAYQDKIAQDKYDFLQTSEVFRQAMMIGMERFEWSKKSF